MTTNQIQGIFGEFVPVLDSAGGTFTADQVQGIFGVFHPVLDAAQTAGGGGGTAVKDIIGMGMIPFAR